MLTSPSNESDSTRIDIDFAVPFRHQLRFTEDCFGNDFGVLAELFQSHHDSVARVQIWVDSGLCDADPAFEGKIHNCFQGLDSVSLAGGIKQLPGGEEVKNSPEIINGILEQFNEHELDRRSYIMVVGGGAVLDAVGYAATVAHRGIRLVRLPTTTLAQADSGVGVKNAVNWFGKKNWKGTFGVPWAVVNDQKLLQNLPDRDFRCGFSEAVKVALLKDSKFFNYLHENAESIFNRIPQAANHAIRQSVMLHIDHITRGGDPFELEEARPLDFGHWSAHKLEGITQYQVRHGEAVAIGVAVDVAYSHLRYGLPAEVMHHTFETFEKLGLPLWHEALGHNELFDGLEEFRQHLGGQLTVTMLAAIGEQINAHEIDRQLMKQAIELVANRAPNVTTKQ